jgi:small nuclear ribonucleoprotein (snRNP)-like protein
MISVNKPNQSKNETRQWLESYLNKSMKIKITDGRVLIGIFLCTDKNSNVILGSCQEHLNNSGTS